MSTSVSLHVSDHTHGLNGQELSDTLLITPVHGTQGQRGLGHLSPATPAFLLHFPCQPHSSKHSEILGNLGALPVAQPEETWPSFATPNADSDPSMRTETESDSDSDDEASCRQCAWIKENGKAASVSSEHASRHFPCRVTGWL